MTDILAAVGMIQLERYDELLDRRFEIISLYERLLNPNFFEMIRHEGEYFRSSAHLLLVNIKGITENERNQVIIQMAEKGIATNVHYKPLPLFTAYKNLGFDISHFPNSFSKYLNELSLPLHTLLSNDDVVYISATLNSIVNEFERH